MSSSLLLLLMLMTSFTLRTASADDARISAGFLVVSPPSVFLQGTCLHVYVLLFCGVLSRFAGHSVVLQGMFACVFYCFAGPRFTCAFCCFAVYVVFQGTCLHAYSVVLQGPVYASVVLQGTYLHVYCSCSGPGLCIYSVVLHGTFTCVFCFTGYVFTRVFWCFAAHIYMCIPLFCRVYVYVLSFCKAHVHSVVLQGIRLRSVVLQGTFTRVFCCVAGQYLCILFCGAFCCFAGYMFTCVLFCGAFGIPLLQGTCLHVNFFSEHTCILLFRMAHVYMCIPLLQGTCLHEYLLFRAHVYTCILFCMAQVYTYIPLSQGT